MGISLPHNPGDIVNGNANDADDVVANDQAAAAWSVAHETAATGVHGVSGNIVGTSDTQTLTNKTINGAALSGTFTGSPTLSGSPAFSGAPTFTSPLVPMVDKGNSGTGTVTCDCSLGSRFLITATDNFTLAFSNFSDGQRVEVWILQDGTGSRTVTWPTTTRWLNGSGATDSTTDKPTLTTTASKFDVINFERQDLLGTDGLLYATVRGFKGAVS